MVLGVDTPVPFSGSGVVMLPFFIRVILMELMIFDELTIIKPIPDTSPLKIPIPT